MSHETNRLLASLYNTPHLATESTFSLVENYLSSRNSGISLEIPSANSDKIQSGEVVDGIGYLRVEGPLTYKPVVTMCGEGGTSYQALYEQMESFVDAGVKTVCMVVQSGGGAAYNCFDHAKAIRQLATDNNIKMIGYVDSLAASAAYALLCQNDVIISNPQAEVGSIGCIVSLLDSSKAMSDAGYKRVMISSGKQKHPFDESGGFKKEFLDDLQVKVDSLYEQFVDHVATSLNISPEVVKATEARTFLPEKAMEYGLVDMVMTDFEFEAYMEQFKTTKKETSMGFFNKPKVKAEAKQEEVDMSVQAELQEVKASLESVSAELSAALASLEHYKGLAEASAKEAAEAKAAMESHFAEAAAKEVEARKARLSAVYGDAFADSMFDAIGDLSQEKFEAVVNAAEAANAAQATSPLFKEQGVSEEPAKASVLSHQEKVAAALAAQLAKQHSSK